MRPSPYGLVGLALFAALWQLVGALKLAGASVPSVSDVCAVYAEPWKLRLLGRAAAATVSSAALGLAAGALLGTGVALLAHLRTALRLGLDQLSVLVNAVPAVALGPILIVTVGRDWTPATLAAIAVFFVMYVSVGAGLRSADPRLTDVFHVLGAGRLTRVLYLDAPSAAPAFLGGLKISVTAALVGAVVGEWFGASTGIGIVILNTMLNFQTPLMWAAVLLLAVVSLGAYGILGAIERVTRRRCT